jgi:hypothetical protein
VRKLAARVHSGLQTFQDDLRRPLPGTDGLSRRERFARRLRYLTGRYGWRLLVCALLYYVIRDLVLFVLLPYLAATKLLAN